MTGLTAGEKPNTIGVRTKTIPIMISYGSACGHGFRFYAFGQISVMKAVLAVGNPGGSHRGVS